MRRAVLPSSCVGAIGCHHRHKLSSSSSSSNVPTTTTTSMNLPQLWHVSRRHLGNFVWKNLTKSPELTNINPQRHVLRLLFEDASSMAELESVLVQSFEELHQAYPKEDCHEPLVMAFDAASRIMPCGPEHLEWCLTAMEAWESVAGSNASLDVYHRLLTIYSRDAKEPGKEHHDQLHQILGRMKEKDIEPDDWTIYLCSKVLSVSGYADW
eukprot:PhM_4_TR4647/c0_g1_i1/m.12810